MQPAVEFVEVQKRRGVSQPLRGVSFAAPPAQLTAVVGEPHGIKTTLHRLAAGLDRPENGAVIVLGEDIGRARGRKLRRLQRRVGVVFGAEKYTDGDGLALFEDLSVAQNIEYGVKAAGRASKSSRQTVVQDELRRFDLAHHRDDRPIYLDPDTRRRVAIARALALRAPLTLIDGFDRGVDPEEPIALGRILAAERDRRGAAALLFCRHRQVAEAVADHVVDLEDLLGRGPAYEGSLSEMLRSS